MRLVNGLRVYREDELLPKPKKERAYNYCGCVGKKRGRKHIDIKGKTFWDWYVIKRDRVKPSRAYSYWRCECRCGRRYSVRSDTLRNGTAICCEWCRWKYREKQTFIQEIRAKYRISKKKLRRIRLKVVRDTVSFYSKNIDNIILRRDGMNMSISDIAYEMDMAVEEVRLCILKYRAESKSKSMNTDFEY